MKILKLIIATGLLFVLGSCNDWLTITPKDSLDEDQLFAVGEGYRNSLNGIYKNMATTGMYGMEMTWGTLDVLAQYYDKDELSPTWRSMASTYDYKNEDAADIIQYMWSTAYNSIANCNNLLTRIVDEDPLKFVKGEAERNLIQGEALALRAMLHFDILRLFGGIKDDGTSRYIPYVEKYPSTGEAYLGVNAVMEKVIRDLEQAKSLVAQTDTLEANKRNMTMDYRFTMHRSAGGDEELKYDLFHAYRGFRVNYCAINALLARAYCFAGKYKEAFDAADLVINSADANENKFFEFTESSEINEKVKLQDDLIFGLSNTKLTNNYMSLYDADKNKLYIEEGPDMFDDNADNRAKLLQKEGAWYYFSMKYLQPVVSSVNTKEGSKIIPMIRLSEMYYIQAEYYASLNQYTEATTSLDKVRMGRNCTMGRLDIDDQKTFQGELINEAKREFIGEGQLWYYYKKFNKKPYSRMPDGAFIFPLPKNETIN